MLLSFEICFETPKFWGAKFVGSNIWTCQNLNTNFTKSDSIPRLIWSQCIVPFCNFKSLFSGFAESAPEACLQISIILIKGRCSEAVLRSVVTSFISLSKCAVSTFLTLPTKGKEVKEASWKTKLFFALPFMMMITTPRIISLSILASYLKGWIFLAIFLMVSINCVANYQFVRRDPAKAVFGCIVNIFSPIIAIEDGSKFFLISGLVSNLVHAVTLIVLAAVTMSGGLNPFPCQSSQPSVFQCFNHEAINNTFTLMRCPLKG